MKMFFFVSTTVLLFTTATLAATTTFNCQNKNAVEKNDNYLSISIEDSQVKNLVIDSFQIVRDGSQQKDSDIGKEVFNVKLGALKNLADGTTHLNLTLQDYSDVLGYEIVLSKTSGEAAVVESFQSSDGDNLLHVSSIGLVCK